MPSFLLRWVLCAAYYHRGHCLSPNKMEGGDGVGSSSGAGNDAAWTQWKTLHHQTRDLSPWMTEAISLDHVQTSINNERHERPPSYSSRIAPVDEISTGRGPEIQEDIHSPVRQRLWKKYAIVAAIIFWSASLFALYNQHISDLWYWFSLLVLAIVPAIVVTSKSHKSASSQPAPSNTSVPTPPLRVQGIATFNNYTAQGTTVCSGTGRPTDAGEFITPLEGAFRCWAR